MPAIKEDLHVEQGADWAHGWRVIYNGAYIDETWTARSQVRAGADSATVLHDFLPDVTPEGAVVMAVSAAESSTWEWRTGVYDVEVVNADETITLRVAEGKVTVDPEVTR